MGNFQPTHIAKDTKIQFAVWKVCLKTKPWAWPDYFLSVVQKVIKAGVCNYTAGSVMSLDVTQASVKPHSRNQE